MRGINDIRKTEMHTAEPLIHEYSFYEIETAAELLVSYKFTGIDHIPGEMVQARGNTLRSDLHRLINFLCNKE
jgi:hypothetical protein